MIHYTPVTDWWMVIIIIIFITLLHADATRNIDIAVPSVCLSVTLQYRFKTAKQMIEFFSPLGSPDHFSEQKVITKFGGIISPYHECIVIKNDKYKMWESYQQNHSLTTFRRLLKTHLSRKSFPDYFLDINWLSPVDLAVVWLFRPPKLFAWLIA